MHLSYYLHLLQSFYIFLQLYSLFLPDLSRITYTKEIYMYTQIRQQQQLIMLNTIATVTAFSWCSGYHICLTHRRSPVRNRAKTWNIFFFDFQLCTLCHERLHKNVRLIPIVNFCTYAQQKGINHLVILVKLSNALVLNSHGKCANSSSKPIIS